MVSTCANPKCSASFRHLKQGRLFVFDPKQEARNRVAPSAFRLEYFWLCDLCARRFTLSMEPGSRVRCVSRSDMNV